VFIAPPKLQAKHASSDLRTGGGRFADGRPFIRVRSITTGMINELMKASTLATSHKSRAWLLEVLMSRHRTTWNGGPSTWRQREGIRRACVALAKVGADVNPHSKGTLPVYWAATMGHVETAKVLVEVGTRRRS
jgi:hypothetical protein